MIKKKFLLFLCIFTFLFKTTYVKAVIYGANTADVSSGKLEYSAWYGWKMPGNKRIEYRYMISYSSQLQYQIENINPIGSEIKSGTWIGMYISEWQLATWEVIDIQIREVRKTYTCIEDPSYETRCSCYNISGRKICLGDKEYNRKLGCHTYPSKNPPSYPDEVDYYETPKCISGYKATKLDYKYLSTTISKDIEEQIKKKVYNDAYNYARNSVGGPLSQLQIITDELDSNNKYKTVTIDGKGGITEIVGQGTEKGRVKAEYIYKPNGVCINLKSGKVSYKPNCASNTEARVNNYYSGEYEYWPYFSPLELKTGSNFSLAIKGGRQLSEKECQSFKRRNGSDKVNSSCQISFTLNFPVVQKYYYEEKKNNELIFNGYNFYYRPININNPFPNVPTKNSLWYEWYNSNNKKPNLKDSFKEITYSVDVSNKLAETIRAYNLNNQYPDFDKLSLKGESSFLQSIGVEALTKDKTYSLGGGTKTCVKNGTVSIGSDCS